MRIAIAVFEDAEELDVVGPCEVLTMWRTLHPDEVELVLVGDSNSPIECAKGMRVLADTTWDDLGQIDVLVFLGGRGSHALLGNQELRERLRQLRASGTLLASVATGALVYADAGLLDGLPATTYWNAFDELLPLGREISPRPKERFIDTGDLITTAGASAGIDMALYVVGRLGFPERAREIRRAIQHDPQSPY